MMNFDIINKKENKVTVKMAEGLDSKERYSILGEVEDYFGYDNILGFRALNKTRTELELVLKSNASEA